MDSTDPAIKMPQLARNLIDTNAVQVLSAWINSLPGTPARAPPTITPYGGAIYNQVCHSIPSPINIAAILFTLEGSLPSTKSTLQSASCHSTLNSAISTTT